MINKIWFIIIVSSIIYSFFSGSYLEVNNQILKSGEKTLEIFLFLLPTMAIWTGIMNIANDSGMLNKLSSKMIFFLKYIFPDLKEDSQALKYIASNIIFNLFGIGNAATPLGLKAMEELQKLNVKKDVASRSMITFLVIVTTGLTLIPSSIIALRLAHKSSNPEYIIIPTILTSLIATIIGLIIDRSLHERRK